MTGSAAAPPLGASVRQAGGGQPGGEERSLKEVNASLLAHLEQIFYRHAGSEKTWKKDQVIAFLHHVQADRVTDPSANIATKEVRWAGAPPSSYLIDHHQDANMGTGTRPAWLLKLHDVACGQRTRGALG